MGFFNKILSRTFDRFLVTLKNHQNQGRGFRAGTGAFAKPWLAAKGSEGHTYNEWQILNSEKEANFLIFRSLSKGSRQAKTS
ncbi:MAG: hypothetical protein A2297_01260 [Elusimicrobia bacterium RIFOXYB2_FULL_48_7]|nr:MAG: hypothetical protein A2297_01260 [Elusimicrobia bacterium RIFOXYB2_FULL_48_7]